MASVASALGYRLWCSFKRKWVLMLIFICIPILLSMMFLLVRSEGGLSKGNKEEGPTAPPPKKKSDLLAHSCESSFLPIAVCPSGIRTKNLMEAASSILSNAEGLKHVAYFDTPDQVAEYLANYSKSQSVFGFCGFGINFIEMSSTNLTYFIRSINADGWHTNKAYPSSMIPGPMDVNDFYIHRGFLALQIAINEAYSKTVLNITLPDWEIQAFPYPSYQKEDQYAVIYMIMGYLNSYGLTFLLVRFAVMMIQEKASGIKELLRINGVKTWMVYASWYFMFGLISFFIALVICIIWKIPMKAGAVLPATNPVMLLIILTTYYWAALTSVGFIASLINEPKFGTLFVVAYWIGSDILVTQGLTNFRTTSSLVFLALLPNGGIFGIFEAIAEFEAAGSGAGFTNLFLSPPVDKIILPIGVNLLVMIASMFIYLMLMAYIGAVKPGPFGRARPWYFIFPTRLWSRVQVEKVEVFSGENGSPTRSLMEPVGNEAIGLETVNLLKIFGSLVAVDQLNLKIYKNQITALLGHNGAGKSTLFSMISGMYSPTSGSVRTGEYDIFHGDNLERFRRDLGFCPQHDLLIDELSVEQHLIFFGMVKGLSHAEAKTQSDHWTQKFKIYDGRHKQVSELSGGMKRKLCLSVALVGNPQWLLLDEPTSGLDPESRRDIWDVLLTIRGNRTIVISTHFMEEADVLGDRIAIVAHGQLKCYGTAMFLKRHYGSGYQLNFTTNTGVKGLMNEIKKHVLSATLINETESTLLVGLPASEVKRFPELFRAIESKYGNSVESSLSCTTMDDVFLKVQEDEGVQMTIDEVDMPTMIRETHNLRAAQTKGFKIWQQMEGLFIKRYKWAFFNWASFIVFIVLCPVLGTWMTMSGCNNSQQTSVIDELDLSLEVYKDSLAIVSRKPTEDKLADAFEKATLASGSTFTEVSNPNITSALLNYAQEDLFNYRARMVVALDSSSDVPNALYSTLAYHSMPIAYSMLANALISQENSSATIQTYSYPYTFNEANCSGGGSILMIQWAILWIVMGVAILASTSYFVVFPHTERITQMKHLQLMTGAHPLVYWLTTLIADFTIYMIPVVLTLIMIVALDTSKLFTYCVLLWALTLVLILFGLGGILFAYFCSYFFKTYTSAMELCIFLSSMSAIVSLVGSQFDQTKWFPYVFNLIPWIPFAVCLTKIVQWASQVAVCSTCQVGILAIQCEQLINGATLESFGMKEELIYLAVDPFIYLFLILLIDVGAFRPFMRSLNAFLYGPIIDSTDPSDLDVAGEKELVDASKGDVHRDATFGCESLLSCEQVLLGGTQRVSESHPLDKFGMPPIFVCDHLGKKFRRSLTATYDVSFTIQKGECFGLLGVNGAGKSTTFGMLTGSVIPTRGDARIMNYSLSGNRTQYLKRLGYCPQLDGLLLELSARTLLSVFGRLRGVPSSELANITQKWIDVLDMTNICDRPCKDYSGGNKRKLSTALALIADPPVVLLDEPTTGVDPVIRRKIWAILKHCRESNGQTVIITSHSMDECEAVCGRLTIMVKGLMKCIGTVPRLKTVYGQGYILLVKLVFSCTEEQAVEIQSKIEKTFSPHIRLQDKQHGLFNFHITSKSVKLHYMFDMMLDMKLKYKEIEDFSLSDISLEQVFLSLAKDK
uniref:ATP-binding cassette sub-family A member 3 n=1 Tax=Lygus hesperus TaxID=30085 RepID=A0A0A9W0E8_LYGHE